MEAIRGEMNISIVKDRHAKLLLLVPTPRKKTYLIYLPKTFLCYINFTITTCRPKLICLVIKNNLGVFLVITFKDNF